MIPNSNNVDPLFIERLPDWSRGVNMELTSETRVYTARDGLTQRTRGRATPVYRLSYTERGLSAAQFQQRQVRAAAEVVSPCWVPFWTERARLTHVMTSTTAQIDADPRPDFFAAGQLVYITDGATAEFRTIESVASRTLTLTAGSFTAYGVGAKIYPVRLCRRVQGQDVQRRHTLRSFEEVLIFETL